MSQPELIVPYEIHVRGNTPPCSRRCGSRTSALVAELHPIPIGKDSFLDHCAAAIASLVFIYGCDPALGGYCSLDKYSLAQANSLHFPDAPRGRPNEPGDARARTDEAFLIQKQGAAVSTN
jgi:hypothetical protein